MLCCNRPLSHNAETKVFCTANLSFGARQDVQKQSFLFSWDSKWPSCDKGPLEDNKREPFALLLSPSMLSMLSRISSDIHALVHKAYNLQFTLEYILCFLNKSHM